MRAQRIKTGFHRIGVVGAGLCALPTLALLGYALYVAATGAPARAVPDELDGLATLGAAWLGGGLAFYTLSRALGWVIAGFAGE